MGDIEVIRDIERQLGKPVRRLAVAAARGPTPHDAAVQLDAKNNVAKLWLAGHPHLDLSGLGGLASLRELHVARCGFGATSVLATLTRLEELHLPGNDLEDLAPLAALPNLRRLRLSRNQIDDVGALANLTQLEDLCLDDNPLTEVAALARLHQLERLDLAKTRVSKLEPLAELPHLSVLNARGTPIVDTPARVLANGPRALRSYFKLSKLQGLSKQRESKIFVLGEAGTGKSSLIAACCGTRDSEQGSSNTLGIKGPWPITQNREPWHSVNGYFWELRGGVARQSVLHWFLRPDSTFILLRGGIPQVAGTDADVLRHWLSDIAAIAQRCTVLVVSNQRAADSDANQEAASIAAVVESELRDAFPGLDLDFVDVDLKSEDGRIEVLQDRILQAVSQASSRSASLPESWGVIRQQLRDLAKTRAHITLQEYRELCRACELNDPFDQRLLLECLHDDRVLLQFPTGEPANALVFLRPESIGSALQQVLNESSLDGRFTRSKLFRVWGKSHSNSDKKLLLELMQAERFDLAYRLAPRSILSPRDVDPEFSIPQLIAKDPPAQVADWKVEGSLRIQYRYRHLPPGLRSRLTVRLSDLIGRGGGGDLVFAKGFLLDDESARALVRQAASSDGRPTLEILVAGTRSAKQQLLRLIRSAVDQLHADYRNAELAELFVGCCCTSCEHSTDPSAFALRHLQSQWEQGSTYVTCRKDAEPTHVAIHSILGNLLGAESPSTPLLDAEAARMTSSHSIDVYLAPHLQRDQLLAIWFKTLRWTNSPSRVSDAQSRPETVTGDKLESPESTRPAGSSRAVRRSSRPPPHSMGGGARRSAPRFGNVATSAAVLAAGYFGVLGYQQLTSTPEQEANQAQEASLHRATQRGALQPKPANPARQGATSTASLPSQAPDAGVEPAPPVDSESAEH